MLGRMGLGEKSYEGGLYLSTLRWNFVIWAIISQDLVIIRKHFARSHELGVV